MAHGACLGDRQTMRLRIRDFRKRKKLSLEELADRVGISTPYLSQIERLADEKRPDTDLLQKIARVLDVPTSRLIADENPVAVIASVGAGARIQSIEGQLRAAKPLYMVACPPQLDPDSTVGVEIEGDSMFPVYSPGDVLFFPCPTFSGPAAEMIGTRCICVDEAGDGWVRLLKNGSEAGLYNLIALNPAADNKHDVSLQWAGPVSLTWPAGLVEKLEGLAA